MFLRFFLSIVLQAILFVCAEAKEIDGTDFREFAHPNAYYANSSQTQSDWHDLPEENMQDESFSRTNKARNTFITRNKADSKNTENNANNTIWAFPEMQSGNVEEWKNAAKPNEFMSQAVTSSPNKAVHKDVGSAYTKTPGQDKQREYIKPEDSIIEFNNNFRIKRKRETIYLSLNNSREAQSDQRVYLTKTEIYGAHAELYFNDDFSIGAGPEYSHSTTKSAGHNKVENESELRWGFQLKLGF